MKIVRIDGSLFFGAVNHVEEKLQDIDTQNPAQKHALIMGTGINFVDVAGAEMIAKEAKRRREMGGGLYLYGVKQAVCELFNKGHYIEDIGDDRIYTSKTKAIHDIVTLRLDPEICRTCTKRIFTECAHQPGANSKG
jgi:SulP family sulfate permease